VTNLKYLGTSLTVKLQFMVQLTVEWSKGIPTTIHSAMFCLSVCC